MLYNRLGFCVLLPWRETEGRRFRGHTPDGPVAGKLPRFVAPQRIVNGQYAGLFRPVARLEVDIERGGTVVLDFEGDLFEAEDQRNWGDASFKMYCTPLARPASEEAEEGTATDAGGVGAHGTGRPVAESVAAAARDRRTDRYLRPRGRHRRAGPGSLRRGLCSYCVR